MSDKKLYTTEDGGIMWFCPGCRCGHRVWVREPSPSGSRWTWNGDMEKPTVSPSILITSMRAEPPVTSENYEQWKANPWEQKEVEKRCHSHLINGVIEFCTDCSHELAGKHVPLEAF